MLIRAKNEIFRHLYVKLTDRVTLWYLSGKVWTKQAETTLKSGPPRSVSVLNQQLYCCYGGAGVMIFQNDLQHKISMPTWDVDSVLDLTETSNGDVIIATSEGLHMYSNFGNFQQLLYLKLYHTDTRVLFVLVIL